MKQNRSRLDIANKKNAKAYLTVDWKDYKWQLKNSIRTIEGFEKVSGIRFKKEEKRTLEKTLRKFPLSITPYYLSLIDTKDYKNDPIFKQAFPVAAELKKSPSDMSDPLHEDADSPCPGLVHRYPDRVLLLVSNRCAMYCRHCTRKRRVGDKDKTLSRKVLSRAIEYIKKNKQIRDVLLSGGDPFLLKDEYIDWLLSELRKIKHVEIIRIGTRIPAVLPFRITDNLINILKKYKPLWIATHFNHPRELSKSAENALNKLSDSGIPVLNQTVLLAGVNDCPRIMKKLVHRLVENRVRPYYIYQCDSSEGLMHFRTPIGKGIEILESLIGHTTGFSVPTYVIDAPGGGGKIPVMPNYLISWSTNKVVLRNYEGVITTYKEPDSYEPIFCDRKCDKCNLQLRLSGAKEEKAVGIYQLISDANKKTSLTPRSNVRISRRKNR